ncbi:PREDICTED: uncharacterized protein LOC106726818 [Myotis brandtii]|uniref:uncharacterized protein LOC106726818 n=1 Tax=Myotis brandtii TaxID=109478 RepID=UPI0007040B93|nr:PREDICTED: uncharacterized protein LOC106726818 [Myotis brandtii]
MQSHRGTPTDRQTNRQSPVTLLQREDCYSSQFADEIRGQRDLPRVIQLLPMESQYPSLCKRRNGSEGMLGQLKRRRKGPDWELQAWI